MSYLRGLEVPSLGVLNGNTVIVSCFTLLLCFIYPFQVALLHRKLTTRVSILSSIDK